MKPAIWLRGASKPENYWVEEVDNPSEALSLGYTEALTFLKTSF
jgi:hypothetical protein